MLFPKKEKMKFKIKKAELHQVAFPHEVNSVTITVHIGSYTYELTGTWGIVNNTRITKYIYNK
jgi:hypothetical protein